MLNNIAPDKWKHLIVGIIIGALFQFAGYWLLSDHLFWATGIAFAVVVAISYGWELISKITGKGHYEIMDAVYSIVGGIIGIGLVWLMKL